MVELTELSKSELQRIKTAPQDFLDKVRTVKASKRARFVIDQILQNGYCTTKMLENAGYNHPPRAARDVKELGIALKTVRYRDESGRPLGAYIFDNFELQALPSKTGGRSVLGNELKDKLLKKYGSRCFIFLEEVPEGQLQIDHRIPYEIAGEQDETCIENFMLLSPAANRRKSWTCEHCPNWTEKEIATCRNCFWAFPESFTHTACKPSREIGVSLVNPDAIKIYDRLVKLKGREAILDLVSSQIQDYILEFDSSK